jgi:hypothetical protein
LYIHIFPEHSEDSFWDEEHRNNDIERKSLNMAKLPDNSDVSNLIL